MNKEIQTLIEREAEKRAAENFAFPSSHSSAIDRETFARGAHFALSIFKWRKVEEELPEVGMNIIMKQTSKYGTHYGTFTDIPQHIIDIVIKEHSEWMPIPNND